MKHPSWNKVVPMHQGITLKDLHEENGQNLGTHVFPSSEMQDMFNQNHGNNSFNQVRRVGVSSMTHRARPFEEQSSSTYPVDHSGVITNSMLRLSMSNPALRAQFGLIAGGTLPLTRPVGSDTLPGQFVSVPVVASAPAGVQTRPVASNSREGLPSAQLTIFYAGTVNVYDGVPIDKAQAIMLLAGSGGSWPTKVMNLSAAQCSLVTSSPVTNCNSRPASPPPCPPVPPLSIQITPQKMQATGQNTCNSQTVAYPSQANQGSTPAGNKLETSKPSTPSTSTLLGSQPAVPKALPQARKASLARFLEKRKERVRSKLPYPIKKPSPDRTLPQEEKLSSPNCSAASSHPAAGFDECGEEKLGHILGDTDEDLGSCDIDNEEQNWLKTVNGQSYVAEGHSTVHVSSSCQ